MPAILETTKFGNPILRGLAEKILVQEITSNHIIELIENMRYTLVSKDYGVGLSAPQVGVSKSLIVIALKPTLVMPDLEVFNAVLINPVIVETYGDKKNMLEGCISAGESGDSVCAKVPRPNEVRVTWFDEKATEHDEIFKGFLAHTIQHEVDHLNGILFVDRVEDTNTYMVISELTQRVIY